MLIEIFRVLANTILIGIYAFMLAHCWFETAPDGEKSRKMKGFTREAPNLWRIER